MSRDILILSTIQYPMWKFVPSHPLLVVKPSRKRQEKRLVSKIGTIYPHRLNERFSSIWSLHSSCFCLACADKSCDFSPSLFIDYVHPTSHLFTSRIRLVYWWTWKISNILPTFASYYYSFVIVSLVWLAYFLSHDYFSYINSHVLKIYFMFLSDKGPTLETSDLSIPGLKITAGRSPVKMTG